MKLDMPANTIGKDYRTISNPVGLAPSGSGVQVSVLGAVGVTLALEEGVEINLLVMNLGIDLNLPVLSLPFIDRLGYDNVDQQQERWRQKVWCNMPCATCSKPFYGCSIIITAQISLSNASKECGSSWST
ncbi:MAG: hypothetical protein ACSLEN_07125 [Candidatus Malihini olakiniferum]